MWNGYGIDSSKVIVNKMVFVLMEMIMVIVTVIPANSNGCGSGFLKSVVMIMAVVAVMPI